MVDAEEGVDETVLDGAGGTPVDVVAASLTDPLEVSSFHGADLRGSDAGCSVLERITTGRLGGVQVSVDFRSSDDTVGDDTVPAGYDLVVPFRLGLARALWWWMYGPHAFGSRASGRSRLFGDRRAHHTANVDTYSTHLLVLGTVGRALARRAYNDFITTLGGTLIRSNSSSPGVDALARAERGGGSSGDYECCVLVVLVDGAYRVRKSAW